MGEGVAAVFLADAGLLETTEGHFDGRQVVVVYPHDTGIDPFRHAMAAIDVAGEDTAGQTEVGVVGAGDDLVFIAEAEQ